MTDKQKTWLSIGVFFILFLFAFRKLWLAGMFAYGDSPPLPENAGQAFSAFFSAWQPVSRGITNPQTMTTFLQGLLLLIVPKANFAQHIFYFSPYLLSFIFSYLFLNRLVKSHFAKFIAAFIYTVNPATIGTFIGGASGMMFIHALLPLLVLLLWNLADRQTLKNFLLFSLVFGLAYNFGAYLPFFLFPFVIFFFLRYLIRKQLKLAIFFFLELVAAFMIMNLLNLPFAFYGLGALIAPFTSAKIVAQTSNIAAMNLEADLATYSDNQFLNTAFGGTWLQFNELIPVFAYGFFIPLIAFSSFLICRGKEMKKVILFAAASLAILTFLYLTHLKITYSWFHAFPILLTFRSPAKLVMLLALTMTPLLAFTFDYLFSFWQNKQKILAYLIGLILPGFLVAMLIVYLFPFFTGDFYLAKSKENYPQITIEPYFYEIKGFLNEEQKKEVLPFRTLWFPWDYEGVELKIRWLDESVFATPMGFENFASSKITEYVKNLRQLPTTSQIENFGEQAKAAAVKYIVVVKNLPIKDDSPYKAKSPAETYLDFLRQQKDLTLLKETESYLIFLNQKYQEPEMKKISNSHYQIKINNDQPTALFLAEPFHNDWQAKNNGQILDHQESANQNLFYLSETGEQTIDIFYQGQKLKNGLIIIWGLTWLALIGGLIYATRKKKQ